jgi:cytochrome c5
MNTRSIFLCIALLVAVSAPSQTNPASTPAPAGSTQKQAKNKPVHGQRDGELVFEQNCSRCHNAPRGFSPNISGTIARHMRVRAGLSEQDEQALLRFLNP